MMPTGLITLPLRLGIRSASIALGVTERAVGFAWHAVETLVPGVGGHGDTTSTPDRPFTREPTPDRDENGSAPERAPVEEPAGDPRAEFEREDPRVALREAPPEPEILSEEPTIDPEPPLSEGHVDTETTLVESFAEPGAEDGADAQIRIEPPWEGYAAQTAEEIVGRLDDCSAAELAGAELYEAANKQRSTVLAAVERQLKARASRAGS